MKKTLVPILATIVGVVCAILIVELWRSAPEVPDPVAAPAADSNAVPIAAAATGTTTIAESSASDPAVRAVLAALERILARRDVRPKETVLTFKDDAALARFLDRAGKAGLTVIGRLDGLRAVRAGYSSVAALEQELAQNAADYSDISGNYLFGVPQIPAKQARAAVDQVPVRNDTLALIGAKGDRSQWGRGVTIAVLDTGVASDPTFGSGRVSALDIGLGTAPGTASDDGHGTSVASLAAGMAADAPGVAPAANLLSIRVTDATGTSDIFTIAQGIVTAVDAGATVINVSLGGYGTNAVLTNAIGYAANHGAVIVAAAGNDQAAQLAWPAADPRVVSVGAVDAAEQQVTFSNSGPQLQLTAPGYGVQTAWLDNQRAYVDGTSASAPIVAGAIAAVMSQNPSLTAADAAQLLDRTASDAGAPGADPAYGNGVLNVGWAMNASNPGYVDTAVSSHYYDASARQMDFVVQNRSGRAVSGASLTVNAGLTSSSYLVGNLPPGGSQVIRVPVDAGQLATLGRIEYTTTLTNPIGVNDQVPANNRRSSVLTAPKK
jgi:hypothetical protein